MMNEVFTFKETVVCKANSLVSDPAELSTQN